jgi:integrative and conjugative element protein (TIGR02256 family)
MSSEYTEAPGTLATLAELKLSRSQTLTAFLAKRINPLAELIEVRSCPDGSEVVVFEVEVEVSQLRTADIHSRERLAVILQDQEESNPEVLALRTDFPSVPHLNPRDVEVPRSLCLYEESVDELKLTWTPASFIERSRWWLAETAKGTLHQQDQPLEPILMGNFPHLVLPSNFVESLVNLNAGQPLDIELRRSGDSELYLALPNSTAGRFVGLYFVCPPHVHGAIRLHPRNLLRLNNILKAIGFELVSELHNRLSSWNLTKQLYDAHPIIVVVLPKQRRARGEVEKHESWAVLLSKTIGELGVALGVLGPFGTSFGRVLNGVPNNLLIEEIKIDVLNPIFNLSRAGAATLNGSQPSELKIMAIGLGALGSQVLNNLVRAGFGVWIGVDHDAVLPHNVARHQLTQNEVGMLKILGMQMHLNAILNEVAMPTTLEINILHPGTKESQLLSAASKVDVIVDFSASLPVARKLAFYPPTEARRCSVFLNPSGSDLVMLGEDKNRKVRLDWLEFQYYRELISNKDLVSHFKSEPGRIRYARSCRDVSSLIPQHLLALHAGIASGVLQQFVPKSEAMARVWHSDPELKVVVHNIDTPPVIDLQISGWQVCLDEFFTNELRKCRSKKLPKETGGVLIGCFDQQNKRVYLVDTLPSPPDSEEWPTVYIRGSQGLENEVNAVRERTNNQLQYVGEWHSHPNRYAAEPSEDDRKVFRWLKENAARDGNPPIMIIVGQKEMTLFVDSLEHRASLFKTGRQV